MIGKTDKTQQLNIKTSNCENQWDFQIYNLSRKFLIVSSPFLPKAKSEMKYFIIDKEVDLNSPDEIILAIWAKGPTTYTTWKIDYYRCFNCHLFHPEALNAVDPEFLKQAIIFLQILYPTKVGLLQYPTYVGLTSGFCTYTFGSNNQNRYLWKHWKN